MKKFVFLAGVLFLFSISFSENISIYYFYGTGCPHCARVKPFLEEMRIRYENISIIEKEVYYNPENYELYRKFMDKYNFDKDIISVPIVFIDNKYFAGDSRILNNLELEIMKCKKDTCINPVLSLDVETSKAEITLPIIITSALIDSINPCAFAVMIFLLSYLMSVNLKKKMLKIGFFYILSVYLTYFLAGFGVFQVIQISGMTRSIYRIAAIIAIIAGLINVKDFFWYGRGFTLKIPESRKPTIKKFVQMATVPSAIILGFLVSVFELPCTGGVYIAILSLLAKNSTRLSAVPMLALYNFIFVMPLFVILYLAYFEIGTKKIEEWRVEKRKYMKLFAGLIMLTLGLLMFFEVI